jgi:hypothetical protein
LLATSSVPPSPVFQSGASRGNDAGDAGDGPPTWLLAPPPTHFALKAGETMSDYFNYAFTPETYAAHRRAALAFYETRRLARQRASAATA